MLNFSRRINRRTFFVGLLLNIAILIISLEIFDALAGLNPRAGKLFETGSIIDGAMGVIELLIFCGIFIFSLMYYICLVRQRANDISGKNALALTFFSFLIFGWLLVVWPGQKQANAYGAAPHQSIQVR